MLAAVLAVFVGLAIGGGAAPQEIADPGALVRYGVPVATLIVNLSVAVTIGAIAMALWALATADAAYRSAIDIAAASALVLTIASAATTLLTFLNISQVPFTLDQGFGDKLGFFLTQVGLGQSWLAITLISAAVTVLCFAVTNQTALFFVGLLAVGALVPMALQGHAAGTSGHDIAMTSLGLHILFVCIWLGGLATIALLKRMIPGPRLPIIVERYSTLALISFIVVAASGVVNSAVRLGSWSALATSYGTILILKVIALVLLGIFGLWQRAIILRRMHASKPGAFAWFVAIELIILGIASGLAAALARTATPVTEAISANPTPAELLTGELLPPPLTLARYVTEWHIDLIWLLVCAFGIFFYIAGVVRLRRRGDSWPVLRTVAWVAGMLLLFYITNGGVNVYERYLFSAHMAAHMALGMMVPLLLVPGAPVTLAMRAIHKRDDGSRGAREWILIAVHSWYARLISNPIFATVNFVGSLWLFYYTPIFRWATTDHIGHEWMIVHFLLAGYLFVQSLIGIDPGVNRLSYPLRLVQLLAAMTVHAFFGLTIMSGEGLLLADWYGAMGRSWGDTPMEDQYLGGAIAWSVGEIPNALLAIIIGVQWARSDARLAKRSDRQADRTNDAELDAYNEMLARMAKKDQQQR